MVCFTILDMSAFSAAIGFICFSVLRQPSHAMMCITNVLLKQSERPPSSHALNSLIKTLSFQHSLALHFHDSTRYGLTFIIVSLPEGFSRLYRPPAANSAFDE